MTQRRKLSVIVSICFFAFFAFVDFKNYLNNGDLLIVSGDILDQLKLYMNLPGELLGFLVVIVVYQNIHSYDSFVVETVICVSTSIFYGFMTSLILRFFESRKAIKTSHQ